jgi:hypothetical protein
MKKIKPIYYSAAVLVFVFMAFIIESPIPQSYFNSLIVPVYWSLDRTNAVEDSSTIIMYSMLKDEQKISSYDSSVIPQRAFVSLLRENRPKALINLSSDFSSPKIWEMTDSLLVINKTGELLQVSGLPFEAIDFRRRQVLNGIPYHYAPVAEDSVTWNSDRGLDPAINLVRSAFATPGTTVYFHRGKEVTIDTFHAPVDNFGQAFINFYQTKVPEFYRGNIGWIYGNNDSVQLGFNDRLNVYGSEPTLRWVGLDPARSANRPPSGRALRFDGRNVFVDCNNSSSLRITSNQITLEAWVSVARWHNSWDLKNQRIISKDNNGFYPGDRAGYVLGFTDEGVLSFIIGDKEWHTVSSKPGMMKTNVWYHVAGTYDGTAQKLYINGQLVDSSLGKFSIGDASTTNLWIGSSPSRTEYNLDGTAQEVRIWKVARTQAQIMETMRDTLSPKYYTSQDSGLVAYWPMDEGSGSIVYDKTDHGNTGTLIATRWSFTAQIGQGPRRAVAISRKDFSGLPFLKDKIVILGDGWRSDGLESVPGCYRTIIFNLLNRDFIRPITNGNRFLVICLLSLAFLYFGIKRLDRNIFIGFLVVVGLSVILLVLLLTSVSFTHTMPRAWSTSVLEIDLICLLPFLYSVFLAFYFGKYSRSAFLTFGIFVIVPLASLLSFVFFHVYFYPGDMIALSAMALIVFFPFEVAHERAGLFLEIQRLNTELKGARESLELISKTEH